MEPRGQRGTLRALIVEDHHEDAVLMIHELGRAGYEVAWERVETAEEFVAALEPPPDVILSDYSMPRFNGLRALQTLMERGISVPLIFVSGTLGEELAVEAMRSGAADYVLKDRMARLSDAVRMALEREELRRDRERNQAQLARRLEELRQAHAARRRLLSRLIEAQEEERRLIAGEIHDDSVQAMAAVATRLQLLRSRLSDPGDITTLEKLDEDVRVSIRRLRRLMFELHPRSLQHDSLAATLETYLQHTLEATATSYRLIDELAVEPDLDTRVILYRLCQEALTNARKHARASQIEVRLQPRAGGVSAIITDDGVGFDVAAADEATLPGHLGLRAMRERAELAGGWCRIESTPGQGTRSEFWLPEESGSRRPGAP